MAVNLSPFVGNLLFPEVKTPLTVPGLFQAGSSQAVKMGEILEKTADTNTRWIPIDSDHDASTTKLAVAAVEIESGDKAGYYPIIVPRIGDVFEFELSAAGNPSLGASLYYNTSQKVATSGSNALGYVVGGEHYPKQLKALYQPYRDAGETIPNVTKVRMVFRSAYSYWTTLVPAS